MARCDFCEKHYDVRDEPDCIFVWSDNLHRIISVCSICIEQDAHTEYEDEILKSVEAS